MQLSVNFILKLLFIILLIQQGITIKDCEPKGVHLTFGNYNQLLNEEYLHKNLNQNQYQYQIIYYTKSHCPDNLLILSLQSDKIEKLKQTNQITKFNTISPKDRQNLQQNNDNDGENIIYINYNYIDQFENIPPQQINYQFRYSIGELNEIKLSNEYQFYHKDNRQPKQESKFIVFGDFDTSPNGQETLQNLLQISNQPKIRSQYDFILHLGDISYNLNTNYGQNGLNYMEETSGVFGQIPYVVIPGNHEEYNDYYYFKQYFPSPNMKQVYINQQDFNNNLQNNQKTITQQQDIFQKWVLNDIIFIGINLNKDFENNSQLTINLLKDALLRLNRNIYKWVIVYAHKPIVCSFDLTDNEENYCTNQFLKQSIQDLYSVLIYNDVDLFINGHLHLYERSYPHKYGKAYNYPKVEKNQQNQEIEIYENPEATIFITESVPGNASVEQQYIQYEKQEFMAYTNGLVNPGYGIITTEANTLLYEHFDVQRNMVIDSFKIKKTTSSITETINNLKYVLEFSFVILIIILACILVPAYKKIRQNNSQQLEDEIELQAPQQSKQKRIEQYEVQELRIDTQ